LFGLPGIEENGDQRVVFRWEFVLAGGKLVEAEKKYDKISALLGSERPRVVLRHFPEDLSKQVAYSGALPFGFKLFTGQGRSVLAFFSCQLVAVTGRALLAEERLAA